VILVDTSVWVDHLRYGRSALAARLEAGDVACHPFVLGELACGRLARRREILSLLAELPQVGLVEHDEVLAFVDANRLAGSGIGWVDAHLLASAKLSHTPLWTLDRRMVRVARRLRLAAE
jgi:hypothetical protein